MKFVVFSSVCRPVVALAGIVFAGCTHRAPPPESAPHAATAAPERRSAASADPLSVSGLLGSLSQSEIHNALDPRMARFARCLGQRSDLVPWLSGQLVMLFHVAGDGRVASVQPLSSDLGDRATERCLLAVAEATHFPAPHGGDAEFSWSLEAPADPEVRAPETYPALERALPTLLAAVAHCAAPRVQVTAYVDENGNVVAAGAASRDESARDAFDCVTSSLVGVVLVSPGSYAAKLSTVLP